MNDDLAEEREARRGLESEATKHAFQTLEQRNMHLEAFAAAYCKATDIPPEWAVLCEQRDSDGTIRWFFERRKLVDLFERLQAAIGRFNQSFVDPSTTSNIRAAAFGVIDEWLKDMDARGWQS